MRKHLLGAALTLAAVLLATSSVVAQGRPQVIGVWGEIPGRDLVVHAWVVVPAGADSAEVAREALANQGARPIESAPFSETGLQWPQFTDGDATNDFVVQNYNRADQPAGVAESILQATQATWSGVGSSYFSLSYGGLTDRCPSLVRECGGPQLRDGNNDVAWMKINGCCTLGVTWFMTSGAPEADMGMNTKFSWATNGIADFDVETVLLHENGHVAGLGHSTVAGAVMEATYDGARRQLHQDDIDGVTALYPNVATGSIAGTVTDGTDGIDGATVSTGTGQSTTTAGDGSYTLSDVPTGSSTVTASAGGYESGSQPATVAENQTTIDIDFALAPVPTGTITGTVTDDAASPNAIGGAAVSTDTGESTTTATNGLYTLTGVPTGTRTVSVSAVGYADASQGAVEVTDGGTATANFALTAQSTATSVRVDSFTYSGDGGRDKDKHVSVTIALVDNLGGGAGGASISVRMNSNSGVSATGSGTTGSDGTIKFTWSNAPGDCYTTTVTSVTSGDLTFDPTDSTHAEVCKVDF